MRKMTASAGLVAILAGGMAVAQQRERLPAECRQPLLQCLMAPDRQSCVTRLVPSLPPQCRDSINRAGIDRAGPPAAGTTQLSYGTDEKQRLDFTPAVNAAGPAPVLLFVHGGGWIIGDKRTGTGAKDEYYSAKGWAVASVNYRLVPQATVEQQAADIASAVAYIRSNAARLHVDPDRIVLMGHSAGAYLVALVGTDTRYLKAAGIPLGAIRGDILLDGAGYDVGQQMAEPGNRVMSMYEQAFSKDPKRQTLLSPISYTAAPNVAHWLILPVDSRRDSTAQSQALAAKLRASGTQTTTVTPVPNSTHGKLNEQLGTKGDFATGEVDKFLAGLR